MTLRQVANAFIYLGIAAVVAVIRKSREQPPYVTALRAKLEPYKTQTGYTFADLEKATSSRDPWGKPNVFPELQRLKALDVDGDQIVSDGELEKFTGLRDTFCRTLEDEQYGCTSRCSAGSWDFDGNFSYLAEKGVSTYTFTSDANVDSFLQNLDPYPSGIITRAHKRAIALSIFQVVKEGIEGAICEFGVNRGLTSTFLYRTLNDLHALESHSLHLFDSFEGFPDIDKGKDMGWGFKGMMAEGQQIVRNTFASQSLPVPPMHKGFFSDIPDSEIPGKIAFAFLDGDLYPSTLSALQRVWPRLSVGGIVMIHDFAYEAFPGTEDAAQEFLKDKTAKVQLVGGSNGHACYIGLIRKQS